MRIFLVFLIVLTLPIVASAQDGSVYQCGTAVETALETDPGFTYCDIYARQLAYGENRKKLRADLELRRENFRAPNRQAVNAYHAAVAKRFDAGATETDETPVEKSAKMEDSGADVSFGPYKEDEGL